MKTYRIQILIPTLLAAVIFCEIGTARAADMSRITRVYDIAVAPSQEQVFRQGMSQWESCLRHHGSNQPVYVYYSETGETGHYAFFVPYETWVDMDKHTGAGSACQGIFDQSVAPHFTGAASVIMKAKAELTYAPDPRAGPATLLWVMYFRIKPGRSREFVAVLKQFTAAAAKAHWKSHVIGYEFLGGGQGSPDYSLAWPGHSWAEFGATPNQSVRDMLASVYGKTDAAALYRKLTRTIRDKWERIWHFDGELSFVPATGK